MQNLTRLSGRLLLLAATLLALIQAASAQTRNTATLRAQINNALPTNPARAITAEKLRSVFISSANAIDSIFTTLTLANGLGSYDASTGVATIKETGATLTPSATPTQANGRYFDVTVAGTQTITGTSIQMKVGGKLISRGTTWDYIPPSDTGLQQVQDLKGSISTVVAFQNLFNKATQKVNIAITNYTPGTGGGEVATPGWILSDKIPFPGNTAGVITKYPGGYNGRIHAFDAANIYIGEVIRTDNGTYHSFTTPTNTVYLKAAIANSVETQVQADSYMLLKGTSYPSTYVSYSSPVVSGVDKVLNAPLIASMISTTAGPKSFKQFMVDSSVVFSPSLSGYVNKVSDVTDTIPNQLFKPNLAYQNQSILSNTGQPNDGSIVSQTGQWWSGYIKIDPTKGNIAKTTIAGGHNGRFYFYNSSKAFISKTAFGVTTAAIPLDAQYVAFIVADTPTRWSDAYSIMCNYGTTALPLGTASITKIVGKDLIASKISTDAGATTLDAFISAGGYLKRSNLSTSERSQLFQPNVAYQNQSILSNTGQPNDGSISNNQTGQWWSGYIEIDPSKLNIARTFITGATNGRFYFYDAGKIFISKTNSGIFTTPIPSNAKYVAFIIATTADRWSDANAIMVNYGTVPLPYAVYDSDVYLKSVDNKEVLAAKITTDLGDRTIQQYLVEKGLLASKQSITLFKPTKVYSITNDTRPQATEYSYSTDLTSSLYIDHLFNLSVGGEISAIVKENGTDRFNYSGPKSVDGNGAPVYNNGVDISTIPKTFTVAGDLADQTVSLNQISVKASYLKAKMIRHLRIGDSTGYGTSTALIDIPDGAPSKVSDFMLVYMERLRVDAGNPANDYIYKPLGTKSKRQIDFSYRGVTKTLQSYTESQGSWAAVDYYLYTDKLAASINQGIWDRLGLGNGTGTDYTGSTAQRTAILTTPEGKFTPVNTSAFIAHMNAYYGGITTYAQAVAKQNDLLANPNNPFFDSSLTGAFRFSLAKYLERYKTLQEDGVTRLVAGSTAGSKVTNVNDYDVCTPTHVTISLGTNDQLSNTAEYVAAMTGMVNQVKAYDANIIVCLAMIDAVGTYFPKKYPNYSGSTLYDNATAHNKAFLFNQQLQVLENASAKTFYLPSYFVQPTAEGVAVKKTPRAKSLAGMYPETDVMYNEWGKFPATHPNAGAYAEIGVSELSALLWTKQYMP